MKVIVRGKSLAGCKDAKADCQHHNSRFSAKSLSFAVSSLRLEVSIWFSELKATLCCSVQLLIKFASRSCTSTLKE